MRQSESVKVRVRIPVARDVYYVVEVKDPSDTDEVSRALGRKDPSNWESDPCFYEHLGDVWKQVVHDIKREDIEIMR
jgi:ribosomal protein L11